MGNENKSLIREFFSDEMLKILYYHACRTDIPDNNEKGEMIEELLGPEFQILGTGTNRIALLHNGVVCKIALDRRGFCDCRTEFKRSHEKPYLAKTFESNMLINICEYWTVLDHQQFIENEEGIKEILDDLSKDFIFNDLGFDPKNAYNWGYKPTVDQNGEQSGILGIIDYGYLYPRIGQEEALTCPHCKAPLAYNASYTKFGCTACNAKYSIVDIQRRMKTFLEDWENEEIGTLMHTKLPNLYKK